MPQEILDIFKADGGPNDYKSVSLFFVGKCIIDTNKQGEK